MRLLKSFTLATIATVCLSGSIASASVYIEPYVGYVKGEIGSDGDDVKGMLFGGRLGYGFAGLSLGVDYSTGTPELDIDGTGIDVKVSNLGAFLSYKFPILIRAWVSYYPMAKGTLVGVNVDPDDAGPLPSVNGDGEYSGKGTEFGIGYTGLPFVAINLSMYTINYDKFKHPALSTEADVDTDNKGYFLSLSLPLSL